MSELSSPDDARWPVASLDPIERLHVLAAGLPGTVVHERVLDAPYDEVWAFLEDLPRSVPTFERTVSAVTITHREDTRLAIRAKGTWRVGSMTTRFDVDLEPGWCWMVSRPRFYVVGMAAVPEGKGTRWGHLEGLAFRGRLLDPVLRAARFRHHRHVDHDIDGIEHAVRRDGR